MRKFAAGAALMFWVSSAMAAAAVAEYLPPDLRELPWFQLAMGTGLAFWGAMVRNAHREVTQSMREPGQRHPPLPLADRARRFVLEVVISSGVAACVYMFGYWWRLELTQIAVALLVCGYFGVYSLEILRKWAAKRGIEIPGLDVVELMPAPRLPVIEPEEQEAQ